MPGGQCPPCLFRLGTVSGITASVDDTLLDLEQVREFGEYELLQEVARGGMGVVYRARQAGSDREVALKMIVAGQLATPESVARFRQEAAVAERLDHPNIVPVYEVGEFETQHFFSMRYIPGERNIATWARELPLTGRYQAIARQMALVARAIGFAHQRGVLHRDLKPSNILIDEHGSPQITDFGLAKLLDGDITQLTVSSAVLGSPSYMAPEQVEPHGREITAATDVYGLGAVLYELLSGRPPFGGASPLHIVRQVMDESAPRLAAVPADLATLCRKCLAKEPRQRYSSALALADDLDRFARGEPVQARSLSALGELRVWARRKPAVASLMGALLLALFAGIAGVFWQWRLAERANTELRATLGRLEWRALDVLYERDYAPRALSELAARLRQSPDSWQAASYAMSILEQRPFAFPSGPPVLLTEEWFALPPAFSVQASRAAFVGKDGRIRVLDTMHGKNAAVLQAAEPSSLAFSPDGKHLAVGQRDGAILLFELASGARISRTQPAEKPIAVLCFSADGQSLAFAAGERIGSGRTADYLAGTAPAQFLAAAFTVTQLRSSANGAVLLAWGAAKELPLLVWERTQNAEPFQLPLKPAVRDAAIDSAGRRIALIAGAYEAQVWDVARRERLCALQEIGAQLHQLEITPDGRRVLVGDHVGITRAYSADTGLPCSAPMVQRYQATSLSLDHTGGRAFSATRDFTARLWDVHTGQPLCEAIPHEGVVEAAAIGLDGRRAFTLGRVAGKTSRVLHSWIIRSADQPRTFRPEGGRDHDASRLSPDERLFAVGAFLPRNSLTVFDTATGLPVLDRFATEGAVYECSFSPDGRRLIVATNAGWLYGWSVPDPGGEWRQLWPPLKTAHRIQPGGLAPDGSVVALGGTDGILRLHDARTSAFLREMRHGALIKGLRFSPDGTRVVTAGVDGFAHVWEVATGKLIATLRKHTAEIVSARFSPDGGRIVTASYDSTGRVWDAATGRPLTPPLRHHGELSGASFSPDGRRVGTASRDGTARVWDAGTGQPCFEPIAHPTTVQYFSFHPDGRRFITVDLAGFRLWDAATGEPVTIPYHLKMHGGLGLDSACFQDIISPRGGHLAASNALDAAVYWPLLDPPAPVPAWFPDFLDALATGGIATPGELDGPVADRLLPWRERARTFAGGGYYEMWLQRYLAVVPLRN